MAKLITVSKPPEKPLVFDKPGQYVVFFHNMSGKVEVELAVKGAEVDIFGLYTGFNNESFQIETVQHHTAPGALSNLLIKGVFDGTSRFNYQGLIRIEKEGQQSHAYQKNQNIILSSQTFVESKPFLEILANDVFCTHGSTTGRLNEEQLFYAISRGLSKEDATRLLIDGFIGELYEKISGKVPSFKPPAQ